MLERERELIIDFLRSRGYFEANVGLDAQAGRAPPARSISTSPSASARPIRSGRSPSPATTRIATDELDPMFRHGDWITLWNTPVPFTQKQLREDIDALTKRYRALGYAGVRVTTDFSVQKSIDRAAKNVRIGITINERKRIAVAFEGNASQSSSTLQDELTLFSRGSYDDFEVGASADAIQRHYQQQGHFFARVDWRRERLSADRGADRLLDRRGAGAEGARRRVRRRARCSRRRSSPRSSRCGPTPSGGSGSGGYATGKQLEQDVERLVEHYHARGFVEAKARVDAATAPRRRSARWARPPPPPRPPRARPARSTSASPSTRDRA